MAPSHEDSASSSEDDAPESVSLTQSKRNIQKSDDALQRVHAAEKVKRKLRNKEKDRKLKEQAENSKRRRKEERNNDGDANLRARMERAMQEAAEELDDDGDLGEDGCDSDEVEDEFTGLDGDSDEDSGQTSDPNSEDDDEEMDSEEQPSPKTNPNHLPDHLFTSAFASATTKTASKRKAKEDQPARSKPRKRVRSNGAPKDVLIGSRTIRTLAPGAIAGASTLPSAKVKKFLDRSLGLKGSISKKRGWERRPVNLGVMRRDGPAVGFVRNR
ncbi:hypothetical protein C0995_007729 [Termitomyces sp. Mi166|nr:hypothetical protein C0995_007729 [Termitomyces sp. Mi166\